MTIHTLANILIGVALVGWIVYRQLTWRIVSISRMWRMPLFMAGIGILMLAQTKDAHRISTTDLAVLIVELLISLGVGALMGRIAVFRPRAIRPGDPGHPLRQHGLGVSNGRRDRRSRRTDARADASERRLNADGTETVLETRTGWLGLVLWIVLIGVRIGVDAVAMNMGAVLVTATGVILLMVAANRVARVFVFATRVQSADAVTA